MEDLLTISLAVVCTVVPLWIGQRHGVIRYVSPMHLVAYLCLFGFLLKAATYAAVPELAFFRRFISSPWGGALGALYLALFVLMICVGYRLACRSFQRADGIGAARMIAGGLRHDGMLLTLAFGTAAATIALILRARGAVFDLETIGALNQAKQINVGANGVGATLAGIKTLFVVPKFAFVLLLAHGIVTGKRRVLLQAILLAGLLVAIALVSGDRFELVELFVFGLATYLILGERINLRAIAYGAILLVLIGLVSAYMTQLRLGSSQSVLRQVIGSTYFLDFNAAVMVTDRVSADQLLLGQSYLWWSFGWVPRAVWPDKPAIDLGVFFKRDIMGVYTGGAFNVTGPGEAFINFGWAGLAMGAVLGWLYRKGEVALLSPLASIRHGAFFLYPMLFYPFVQATLQSSFSAFIVGAAAQLVLLLLMIHLFLPRFALWTSPRNKDRRPLYVA